MLLSCGDALIDFLPAQATDGRDALVPVVGGMARLGAPTGFVGGLSTDLFGRMIADHATDSGVDLRLATRGAQPTTLAFVRTIDGEARYAFYDEQTASRQWTWRPGSIRFAEVDALHVGSTTLVERTGYDEASAMIGEAERTTTISFDPNCRPGLVHDKADYARRMEQLASRADIVRLSDADFAFLYGGNDYARKATALLGGRTHLFVVTRGSGGVQAWHKLAGTIAVEAPHVDVVDTIGAGDSFQAALLYALHRMNRIEATALAGMKATELQAALAFAAYCAAQTCRRAGADLPRLDELDATLLTRLWPEHGGSFTRLPDHPPR
jgi:fructokinase